MPVQKLLLFGHPLSTTHFALDDALRNALASSTSIVIVSAFPRVAFAIVISRTPSGKS